MGTRDSHSEAEALRAEIKRLRQTLATRTPSLPVLLKRRGFSIYRKEPMDDLLIPGTELVDSYYEMLKRYSFRLFLRDVINQQPCFTLTQVTRYATRDITASYLDYLAKIGLVSRQDETFCITTGLIRSFGETLEWFVAEVFRREFEAEALRGVKVRRPGVGGDYDLLAKMDGAILCMEIKSSPPKQIQQREVKAFWDRATDLMPEIAIFFVDTELRMKDKLVPMFEDEIRARGLQGTEVKRLERELFEIVSGKLGKPQVFIMNAMDSIAANVGIVLARYFRAAG